MNSISEAVERIKNLPQGIKASIAFFFANLITKGIAYITTPLYTRFLTTEEYGQVSIFLTWVNVFGILAMFCLSAGVFNNGMIDYPTERSEYSYSMLILSNLITIGFYAVLLCLYPFIKDWIGLDLNLVLLMGAIFLFQPAYNFWIARQRYELKYKMTVIWTVVSAFLSPAVAVACRLIFKKHRLYARVFGAEVTLIVIYILFYIYIGTKSKWKLTTKFWRSTLVFNLPLIPHYLSTYLLGSLDKIMISHMISDSATAFYSVAYSVASVTTIIWTAVNSSLIPYTYENCKKKNYQAISNATMPILTVFATVCIFVIMLAPEAVAIMATADYKEAIYVIPPIVGGVFFQVQYYIYANVVYYYKKPKYVMYASVTATILNLALNYIFIQKFGYIAAGYTTIFCYLVQACIDYFAMKMVVGISIYNMRYLCVLSLVVIAISLLSNFIYDYTLIRYAIICLLLVLCIIFRKKLLKMVQLIKGGKEK